MKSYALGIIAGLILMSGSAFAGSDSANSPPNRGERSAPTPEALAACQNQSEGAQVVIATPRGDKLKAVCRLMDGKLVAFPAGPPPGRRMPPPPGSGQNFREPPSK